MRFNKIKKEPVFVCEAHETFIRLGENDWLVKLEGSKEPVTNESLIKDLEIAFDNHKNKAVSVTGVAHGYANMLETALLSHSGVEHMLKEIASFNYKCYGFPYIFISFSQKLDRKWEVSFRNPVEFDNEDIPNGETPAEACKNALSFIEANPNKFVKS